MVHTAPRAKPKRNGQAELNGKYVVDSTNPARGVVTLFSPELSRALKAGDKGNFVIYVKVEEQKQ